MSENRKNAESDERTRRPVLYLILLIDIIVVAAIILILMFMLKSAGKEKKEEAKSSDNEKIETVEKIKYKGKLYKRNKDLFTVLIMGIDREDIEETGDEKFNNDAGQNDVNLLVVLDKSKKDVKIIPVNRDTMTNVRYYDENGNLKNTLRRHLCVAYAYGGGGKRSAESVVHSVSEYLYGIKIDRYCAIDFNAISKANDAVGGVKLTALEDIGNRWKKGQELTLKGDDAEYYIRYRITETSGGNDLRMKREEQYFNAFLQTMSERMKQDISVPITVFNMISKDSVTNMSGSEFSRIVSSFQKDEITDDNYIHIPGRTVLNKETEHDEFYSDDAARKDIVMNTFYLPAEN